VWPRPSPPDLLCWFTLLCLDASLADAEPKTLRYRLLHTAARIVRGHATNDQDPGDLAPGRRARGRVHATFALTAPT
jgi:hypothetical protein